METIKLGEYIGPQMCHLFQDTQFNITIRNNEGIKFNQIHTNITTHQLLHVSDLTGPSSDSIQLYNTLLSRM